MRDTYGHADSDTYGYTECYSNCNTYDYAYAYD